MISEEYLQNLERQMNSKKYLWHEEIETLIAEVRELQERLERNAKHLSISIGERVKLEREADWLAMHYGTKCVQYIDPHWACRDDKACDDCWREASKTKAM